ncbi:SseB family protein [Nocardioides sp. SYSU D00038]|uniref:SseB family protein n=1 Tax=Nocardioides sp. SYSU D00038 TaxID=2812554 RepID=UPI0027DCCDAC|nr:SseB family protein [Nocardioides sp. SYSU D00038]
MDADTQPATPDALGSSGRLLQGPGFPGDTGAADPALAAGLASYAADRTALPEVLAALAGARLLVPVVAVLGEVEVGDDGLARDKTSDMASVLLRGADGRTALLAFSSLETLAAWDADARPVPVTAAAAALAAAQEGAAALLLDLAGPVTCVVEGEDLEGVAGGWRLTRVGGRTAWLRPED